ncbi:MAG: hypothetical protein R2800_13725 [Flavipsychrobacter sp.]
MKKILHIAIVAIGYIILTSSSCKKDDDNVNPSNSSNITPGSGWHVSLFSEQSENKTSNYSEYSFDFATDGSMSAQGSGQVVTGTWKQYQDDGITKFAISLNTTNNNLLELNDDWALVSKDEKFISLKDDNSSKNEQLQFSK